jgi:hypothetical protein
MPDRAYEGCSIATQTAPSPTPIAERAVGAVGMPAQATRGVSLTNDPHSTAAWAQGSRGERLVGEHPEKIQDAMTREFKVEVRAALCFVDAEWSPLRSRSISVESGSVGQRLSANEFVNRAG